MKESSIPVVDLHQALARVNGDKGFYQELLGMLLEDAPRQVEEIREAIGLGDASHVEQVAHSLKGAAASLGAEAVRNVVLSLEVLGRQSDLEGATIMLTELELEIERLNHFAEELE